jgi:hypothetical protein
MHENAADRGKIRRRRRSGAMKKITKTKLSLRNETIRALTAPQLANAAGGQEPLPWSTTTHKCTEDLFCPTHVGVC